MPTTGPTPETGLPAMRWGPSAVTPTAAVLLPHDTRQVPHDWRRRCAGLVHPMPARPEDGRTVVHHGGIAGLLVAVVAAGAVGSRRLQIKHTRDQPTKRAKHSCATATAASPTAVALQRRSGSRGAREGGRGGGRGKGESPAGMGCIRMASWGCSWRRTSSARSGRRAGPAMRHPDTPI